MPELKRAEADRLLDELLDTREGFDRAAMGEDAHTDPSFDASDAVTAHTRARAAVLAAMTRATPDGWRLVPVSATEAMLKEMCELDCVREECRPHLTCSNPVKRFRFQETYARALAAAPEAP